MHDSQKNIWITYSYIACFWLFYPITLFLILLERYCGICFKANLSLELLLLLCGIPLGTYGIYRTDWDTPSKIVAWIVCILAVVVSLIPFAFIIAYFVGVQAT